LNRQMERSEVLIVEARQYEDTDSRIVVPSLFGYTEEARRVKRTVTISSQTRRKWDRESFSVAVKDSLGAADGSTLNLFVESLDRLGATLVWGTGAISGSVNPRWPDSCKGSVLTCYTDGRLTLNFGGLSGSSQDAEFRKKLIERISSCTDLVLPENCTEKYPNYAWEDWKHSLPALLNAISQTLGKSD